MNPALALPIAAMDFPFSVGQCATIAIVLEATTPKPGNVHRCADFEDVTFGDFLIGGVAIAPAMEQAAARGVGQTVLDAVRATLSLAGSNTNLGTILLMAPLAAVGREAPLRTSACRILQGMTPRDARLVYEAIRLADPGGLGRSQTHDVHGEPPADLLEAMAAAAERDLVARQYAVGFADVFDKFVPWLLAESRRRELSAAILRVQLRILAEFPDSLIARKCGVVVAKRASDMAGEVLASPDDAEYARRLGDLDFWMRSDGHRRNPGTTADLVACTLFVALREGLLQPPFRMGAAVP